MVPVTGRLARNTARRVFFFRFWIFAVLPLFCLVPLLRAQAPPETVGRIEGEDILVKGAIGVEVESGRSTTVLASGSDVTVRTGQARLALVEGGEIGVCAPAHFSLLKSGGAITLALDYGRLHARLDHPVPLTIYTPQILATPVAIGSAPRDATIGLDTAGAMCVLTERGAVRIEFQLTGQTLLVPQSGEISLVGGQLGALRGSAGDCRCEGLAARAKPPAGPQPPEVSVVAPARLVQPIKPPEKNEKTEAREDPKPPAIEEPIYKVLMPPLMFDASRPVPPPEPSPEMILLVRRVRVRPAVVFRGRVENPPEPPAVTTAQAQPLPTSPAAEDQPAKKEVTLTARIKNFFRRLASRGPCAGVGCG
jgi:hypothetical protein